MSKEPFPDAFARYLVLQEQAHADARHHDERRHLFIHLLQSAFDLPVEEIALEERVSAAQVRGRIDILFRSVVFEFKRDLEAERGDGEAQLLKYLRSRLPDTALGILTDGLVFDCYVLEDDALKRFDSRDLRECRDNPAAAELWLDSFLFSSKQIRPTSEDVIRRFGRRSAVFAAAEQRLRRAFAPAHETPAIRLKYDEWQRLLAKVYGSRVGDEALFLRHTYLALFARILAYVALTGRAPRRDQMAGIITGEAFAPMVHNLVEEDFFAWVAHPVAEEETKHLLDAIVAHLCVYDLSAVGDEDLLQRLYQELVDPAQRHDLGEYYTPDWLAELTLREAGLTEEDSVLDPTCGSGTFLFTAIRLLGEGGMDPAELVRHALENIMGIDVHPLAVTIARVNYLLALRRHGDFSGYRGRVEIPIYMADALTMPAERTGIPYFPIPVGDGEEFAIPEAMAHDGALLDAAVETMCQYAASGVALDDAIDGYSAWLRDHGCEAQSFWWLANLRLLHRLVREDRNTIWGFLLRNAFRPVYLQERRFSLVVGNPPWLSYRYVNEPEYQRWVRDLSARYGLVGKRESHLTTQMELATLFFCHAWARYRCESGRVAFVMPRSVITGAKQHLRFRAESPPGLVVDLKDVAVPSEPSLKVFGTDSCVYFRSPDALGSRQVALSGTLPRKEVPHAEAMALLRRDEVGPRPDTPASALSAYHERALSGANLYPRRLYLVDVPAGYPVDPETPDVRSTERAESAPPWDEVCLSGRVEGAFLFAAVLSRDAVPFGLLDAFLAALPLRATPEGGCELVSSREAMVAGCPHFGTWLQGVATEWEARKKPGQPASFASYLNHQSKLTGQFPLSRLQVIYTASGSYVAALSLDHIRLPDLVGELAQGRLIVDHKLYRVPCATAEECAYLSGVLNSPAVDAAIKPHQTRGAFKGPRDIHRRPFEHVPIPLFDASDKRHMRIAELSARCHERVADMEMPPKGLGPLRQWVRAQLAEELADIDVLVREITGL